MYNKAACVMYSEKSSIRLALQQTLSMFLMCDARGTRRPELRLAELTVWDVLSLAFEGARGTFQVQASGSVSCVYIDRIGRTERHVSLSLLFFLGYQFESDAEECMDGPQGGRCTRVPKYE